MERIWQYTLPKEGSPWVGQTIESLLNEKLPDTSEAFLSLAEKGFLLRNDETASLDATMKAGDCISLILEGSKRAVSKAKKLPSLMAELERHYEELKAQEKESAPVVAEEKPAEKEADEAAPEAVGATAQEAPVAPKQKNHWKSFALAAAAVLVLCGIGAWWTAHSLYEGLSLETTAQRVAEYGKEFQPQDYVAAYTGSLALSGEADCWQVGEQSFLATLTQRTFYGYEVKREVPFTVTVADTRAPIITFAEAELKVEEGTEFDPVANIQSVRDQADGSLTLSETLTPGTYTLTSTVSTEEVGGGEVVVHAMDVNGLETEATYPVSVVRKSYRAGDVAGPIAVLKEHVVSIGLNENYAPSSNIVQVRDYYDGRLKLEQTLYPGTYVLETDLDVTKAGIYPVVVHAMDTVGHETTREFMVAVDTEYVEETGYTVPDPGTNQGRIYQMLTEELGFNRAVACGILAHMRRESTFLPSAVNPSGYYGLCQWGGGRQTSMMNFCTSLGLPWDSLEGQVYYLEKELNEGYHRVLERLLQCPNTAQGAYDAAYVFGMNFEVSGLDLAISAGNRAMSDFSS